MTTPHDNDAEHGLIACCLLDHTLIQDAEADGLTPGDFYCAKNEAIWSKLVDATAQGTQSASEIEVADLLRASGDLEEVGGLAALFEIARMVETPAHGKSFLRIVRTKSVARRAIRAIKMGLESLEAGGPDTGGHIAVVEAQMRKIGESMAQDSKILEIADVAADWETQMRERIQDPETAKCRVTTPIQELNRILPGGGFAPGQLIVIAARPSVGKTSLAMNLADVNATDNRVPVLVFSLEMGPVELYQSLACSRSRVNSRSARNGQLRSDEQQRIAEASNQLKGSPLAIVDSPSINVHGIAARVREAQNRLARKGEKLGLVVIDYLQLIRGVDPKMIREQQIAEMSRNLKLLAREEQLPVVVLSQLNRGSEKDNREPRISDLRESGAIEQDADTVLLLHRMERGETDELPTPDEHIVKLIHGKVRNGPVGDMLVRFRAPYTRFEDY